MINPLNHKKIILFDGVCNFCNSSINFVIERDKKDLFRFATLQSDIGKNLLLKYKIDSLNINSIVLISNHTYYIKSTAALKIAKSLSAGYPLLYSLIIIPNFMRNKVYDYIAKNRYKWYGKKESCIIPTLEFKKKFL